MLEPIDRIGIGLLAGLVALTCFVASARANQPDVLLNLKKGPTPAVRSYLRCAPEQPLSDIEMEDAADHIMRSYFASMVTDHYSSTGYILPSWDETPERRHPKAVMKGKQQIRQWMIIALADLRCRGFVLRKE